MYGFFCFLFIKIMCCMLYACLCIKYQCGYVWLDDFKLLCAFLYVLYVVQCIVEFKSSFELVVHASTLNKTYLFIYNHVVTACNINEFVPIKYLYLYLITRYAIVSYSTILRFFYPSNDNYTIFSYPTTDNSRVVSRWITKS